MTQASLPAGAPVAVIGAGIIGTATALTLARRGFDVTVFDPFPPGLGGPSRRNAGQIGASDVQPLSTPGIALTGLKMLCRRDGPLKIPGAEMLRLMPWFLRFLATSRGRRYRDACAAMTFLCREAYGDLHSLLDAAGLADKAALDGAGFLYDSAASLAASQPVWAMKQAAGFTNEAMSAETIARRLPAISPGLRHGMLSHSWGHVSDPLEITEGLAEAAAARGVRFRMDKVTGLAPAPAGVTVDTAAGSRPFAAAIVAAGVHSRAFAAALGERLPLAAERGYNLTFPNPGFTLDMPLILPDRGIAITHVTEGLRIGGWAEYAAEPARPANQSYYRSLARISAEIFPGLNQQGAIPWMGNRPSLPDSLPVISRSERNNRVFYNCGHGHYGLTNAGLSARLLAGLVTGGPLPPMHQAFSIRRFN